MSRFRTLFALGTCAAMSSGVQAQWGTMPWPFGKIPSAVTPVLPLPRSSDALAKATQAEQSNDLAQAAVHYDTAVREAAMLPQTWRTEALRHALPRHGRVLAALGRYAEAEAILRQALELPPPMPSQSGDVGLDEVRRAAGVMTSMTLAAARGMNQRLVVDGEKAPAFTSMVAFRLPATDVPAALLAEVQACQGRHDEVRSLWNNEFQQYLAALERVPVSAKTMVKGEALAAAWHMALALQAAGAVNEAVDAFSLALTFHREHVSGFIGQSPSVDALLGSFQQQRALAATAVQLALQSGSPAHRSWALGELAASKALANRYVQRRRALLAYLEDRAVQQARESMEKLEAQLLQLPIDGEAGVRAWADWSNDVAAALAPAMPALNKAGLGEILGNGQALLPQLHAALGVEEALIGFLRYEPVNPLQTLPAPARLVRYTIASGESSLQDIGPANDVERLVRAWRASSDAQRQQQLGRQLHASLLADLPAQVSARRSWVLDPDGLLALLPFEALSDTSGAMLIERHSMRYLTSLAQLAQQRQPVQRPQQPALIVSDPQYPLAGISSDSLPAVLAQGTAWHDAKFQPLPETRIEARAVATALRSMGVANMQVSGALATPASLHRVQAPAFLHVASHGFVVPVVPQTNQEQDQRVRMLVPGLMSGLVLAPDSRGPIFTGNDLATLDLRGTRLVVLSACDTGNGSLDVHEGVMSLRRAAEEAGARATLTSLWPVPSQPTVKLMERFYKELAAGRTHSDALQSAKLSLIAAGAGTAEWSGFLLAGADR